jgi:hypothetical protein
MGWYLQDVRDEWILSSKNLTFPTSTSTEKNLGLIGPLGTIICTRTDLQDKCAWKQDWCQMWSHLEHLHLHHHGLPYWPSSTWSQLIISVALLNSSKTTVTNAPHFFLQLPTLLQDISPVQIFQAHANDKPSGSKTGVHLCIWTDCSHLDTKLNPLRDSFSTESNFVLHTASIDRHRNVLIHCWFERKDNKNSYFRLRCKCPWGSSQRLPKWWTAKLEAL